MTPGSAASVSAMPPPPSAESMFISSNYVDPAAMPAPFTMEELGFAWLAANGAGGDRGVFSPSAIPVWLREQSLTDLGLPVNGSDGIFLQMSNTNGWSGDFAPMPEAW